MARFADRVADAVKHIPTYGSRTLSIFRANKGSGRSRADDDAFTTAITVANMLAIYRRGLGRKITDKAANDTFSKWFTIESESETLKDAIEDINREFKIPTHAVDSHKRTQLFGHTAWALGYDDNAETIGEPLEHPKSINDIAILSKENIKKIEISEDANDERYGEIDHYVLHPFKSGGEERSLHHSRALHFMFSTINNDPYGLSVLEAAYNCLYVIENNIWSTGQAFYRNAGGFPVITVPPKASNDIIMAELQDQMSEINSRTGQILPEGYTLDFKGAAGVALDPRRYYEPVIRILAGIVGMPENILLGLQKGRVEGSEIDLKDYAETIMGYQRPFTPHFIELYKRFQDTDQLPKGDINIRWNPLLVQNEEQKARTGKLLAETAKIEIEANITTPEEVRKLREKEQTQDSHASPKGLSSQHSPRKPQEGIPDRSDKLEKEFVNSYELEDRLADKLFDEFEKMRRELIRQVPLQVSLDAKKAVKRAKVRDGLEDIELTALEEEFGIVIRGDMEEAYTMGGTRALTDLGIGGTFPPNAPALKWLKTHSLVLAGKETKEFVEKAKIQILLGVEKGEGMAKISRRITDVFDITRDRATVIARTEVMRALNEGRINGYAAHGVERVELINGPHPCPECADLEGDIFTIEEAHGLLPVHPNCVCTVISAGKGA